MHLRIDLNNIKKQNYCGKYALRRSLLTQIIWDCIADEDILIISKISRYVVLYNELSSFLWKDIVPLDYIKDNFPKFILSSKLYRSQRQILCIKFIHSMHWETKSRKKFHEFLLWISRKWAKVSTPQAKTVSIIYSSNVFPHTTPTIMMIKMDVPLS